MSKKGIQKVSQKAGKEQIFYRALFMNPIPPNAVNVDSLDSLVYSLFTMSITDRKRLTLFLFLQSYLMSLFSIYYWILLT